MRAERPRQGGRMPVGAIVVGGLGVGAAKTVDAIMSCRRSVTWRSRLMGRSDQGSPNVPAPSATRSCCRSRWSRSITRHDPGPQTLLTSHLARAEYHRLYWHLMPEF